MEIQEITISVLLLKYGKLLLQKKSATSEFDLLKGQIDPHEQLTAAIAREVLKISSWEVTNIRLLKINVYKDSKQLSGQSFELVFVVDAVKKQIDAENKHEELKWVPLNDVLDLPELDSEAKDNIKSLVDLIHKGKTLDLEHLPPVFSMKLPQASKAVDLLALPKP